MRCLTDSALPLLEMPADTQGHDPQDEGFVEEAVILRVLTAAGNSRVGKHNAAAKQMPDALDYAGWSLASWQSRAV